MMKPHSSVCLLIAELDGGHATSAERQGCTQREGYELVKRERNGHNERFNLYFGVADFLTFRCLYVKLTSEQSPRTNSFGG